MKTIELSTDLIGVSGMFCTYHGWGRPEDALYGAYSLEEDFNNGDSDIHPDYAYMHWDNKAYMKEWNEAALSSTEDLLNEVFDHFELEGVKFIGCGYYSPREYNFGGDQSNFDLEIPDNFLYMVLASVDKESLERFLKEKYSSRSGFISFTPNNIKDLIEEIDDEPSRCWGALISFLVSEYMDYEDCREEIIQKFVEELSSSNSYTSFVDTTELDEWRREMKEGTLYSWDLEEDWQKELFKRDFESMDAVTKIMAKLYTEGETIQTCSLSVVQSLGYDESWVDFFEGVAQAYFEKVESYNLKLEI